ncbi:MAG: MarR family transcriptional regulator [Pseudonocardia sp.]|uniref:MarR family winged helix-turn-helix transcriptional regulator n=1 Tax=unclassified Pseudonocardia TaxID=2619320 RepID=UPI00086E318D|nr:MULTISPECIES: MarR family transcriptional regulator [unclassified Pseudonocardia]MBN9113590.1 MarR family transcriptional regulator [Pseudonocardia sp.]ODU29638.1 MAG: hypothetical protein ABS80_01655 [Pseudonocardia sp. SCN 72-51]ODV00480.1 MAG: hypothetical protein ABT15_29370 [Pseudonocardia sp. SCN 73-27]
MDEPVVDLSIDLSSVPQAQAEVVEAVLAANRLFVAVASRALAGIRQDVTMPQFRVLVLLGQAGQMTVAQLAADLQVVPSTATRMCDRLLTKRLITRRSDRRDRRRAVLALSAAGEALLAESTRRRTAEIARLLAVIPADEHARVAEALRTLVSAGS